MATTQQERKHTTFEVVGLGTFTMNVTPTVREIDRAEEAMIQYLGEDGYYNLKHRIAELQIYQQNKNKEKLGERYDEIRKELRILTQSSPKEPAEIEKWREGVDKLTRELHSDGNTVLLTELQEKFTRVQEAMLYEELLTDKPDNFDIMSLTPQEFEMFRAAAEDAQSNFRSQEQNKKIDTLS